MSTRTIVDVVGEEGIINFRPALQLKLDDGWTLAAFSCTDSGGPNFWYSAVITKAVESIPEPGVPEFAEAL